MIKMTIINRLLLLLTGHIAGYQIIKGMTGYDALTIFFYTVTFGVLVLACLLLILFGFEILENNFVVVAATLIPLSLSQGLIIHFLPESKFLYLFFIITGFTLVLFTRIYAEKKVATIVLAIVHGIAGMFVFLLPIILSFQSITSPQFSFVGIGGALIGIGGLLLAFLKTGNPLLSKETIFKLFPTLLLLMTGAFVYGLAFD